MDRIFVGGVLLVLLIASGFLMFSFGQAMQERGDKIGNFEAECRHDGYFIKQESGWNYVTFWCIDSDGKIVRQLQV